jgi:hypothetical protein
MKPNTFYHLFLKVQFKLDDLLSGLTNSSFIEISVHHAHILNVWKRGGKVQSFFTFVQWKNIQTLKAMLKVKTSL